MQSSKTKFKPTTADELKTPIALHIAAGVLKFPQVKLLRNTSLRINVFLKNMKTNRFFNGELIYI